MGKAQHMDANLTAGGKQAMSLCARMSAIMILAALGLLGVLLAVTGDWSYAKLAGVLAFLAGLSLVLNVIFPARRTACGQDKTECGDAR